MHAELWILIFFPNTFENFTITHVNKGKFGYLSPKWVTQLSREKEILAHGAVILDHARYFVHIQIYLLNRKWMYVIKVTNLFVVMQLCQL